MGELVLSGISVCALIAFFVFLIKDMKQSTELLRRRVIAEERATIFLEQICDYLAND